MPMWVPLKEVFANPKLYGGISEIPINYIPEHTKIILEKEKTGYYGKTYETEMHHKWFATQYQGRIYFITERETESSLILAGRDGLKCGVEAQKEYAKLYGNKKFGIEGEIWTEDTLPIIAKDDIYPLPGISSPLPSNIRAVKNTFWTAKQFKMKLYGLEEAYGFICVCPNYYYNGYDTNIGCLLETYGSFSCSVQVHPLVRVPSDVLVDTQMIKKSKENNIPLNITTPSMIAP